LRSTTTQPRKLTLPQKETIIMRTKYQPSQTVKPEQYYNEDAVMIKEEKAEEVLAVAAAETGL
jgi:hypothetical protein